MLTKAGPPMRGGHNKGCVGRKWAFTLDETRALSRELAAEENWHDLALLSVAQDSVLRAEDLLSLTVANVTYSTGGIRDYLGKAQDQTGHGVFPPLSEATKAHLELWIRVSGKSLEHFLFTRSKPVDALPIGRKAYSLVVKGWAERLGQPPEMYSTHSLRRTKPEHIFWLAEKEGRGEQVLVLLSKILGHKSVEVTTEYLGITQRHADALWRRHSMIEQHEAAS